MIIIDKIKIDEVLYDQFAIIQDGINWQNGKDGHVQLDFRLSDMDSEGEFVFIAVTDNIHEIHGDYLPLELDKSELKQLIEYLTKCHDAMP